MENWSVLILVAGAAFALGWWARSMSVGPHPSRSPSPGAREAADAHDDLLGEDVDVSARIAAIKRLRGLRPDLDLKTAKDAIDLVASRRTPRA